MNSKLFLDRFSFVGGAASIAALVGFLFSLFLDKDFILTPRWQVFFVCGITFTFCFMLLKIHNNNQDFYFKSPKLIQIIPDDNIAIFLFSECKWVSYRFKYSIFYMGDIEYFLGPGEAINIQEDKKIQIAFAIPDIGKSREMYDRLSKQGKDELKKVIIKPGSRSDV